MQLNRVPLNFNLIHEIIASGLITKIFNVMVLNLRASAMDVSALVTMKNAASGDMQHDLQTSGSY